MATYHVYFGRSFLSCSKQKWINCWYFRLVQIGKNKSSVFKSLWNWKVINPMQIGGKYEYLSIMECEWRSTLRFTWPNESWFPRGWFRSDKFITWSIKGFNQVTHFEYVDLKWASFLSISSLILPCYQGDPTIFNKVLFPHLQTPIKNI